MANEVCAEWKEAFQQFVKYDGKTPQGFLDHLSDCRNCQVAVEKVFDKKAKKLERLLQKLKDL